MGRRTRYSDSTSGFARTAVAFLVGAITAVVLVLVAGWAPSPALIVAAVVAIIAWFIGPRMLEAITGEDW